MPLAEARRVLTLCAVCNYCDGYCETFRAAGRRRSFGDGDIHYLAHLCHQCGDCLPACQYAPPHAFAIDVPKVLEEVRRQSWPGKAWPVLAWTLLVPAAVLVVVPGDVLFAQHGGDFYAVLPWGAMTALAALPLLWSLAVLACGLARFWRETGGGNPWSAVPAALGDAFTLRNLHGGGVGCDGGALRRWSHHAVVWGFLLCFAATATATLYHHLLDWPAPYPPLSLPVALGTMGGLAMVAGCLGLLRLKRGLLPALLLAVAATGLALLALRGTVLMGMLLAVHLGLVAGFFATLGRGKFAHAFYRFAALLRAAMERRQ